MAKTGRPRKPTALHKLNGNPSNLKDLGKYEPKPAPVVELPAPPSWMNTEGKKVWKRLAPQLERLGLLTVADIESFTAACQSFGLWVECERYFRKKDPKTGQRVGRTYEYTNRAGETNTIVRPEMKIAQNALTQWRGFVSEFGVSPAARTHIEVKGLENNNDPMEDLLSGIK